MESDALGWRCDSSPAATVRCGDCLHLLKDWAPTRPICNLVFTSPPYVDARSYGIDFNLKGEDWVHWCADRFMACLDVCGGLVAFVVQGRTRNYEYDATPAKLMVELCHRGAKLRNPPIYHRVGIPGSGGPDWLRSDYEWVVCATRRGGRLPWSENTAMGHLPKWRSGGYMSHRKTDGSRLNAAEKLARGGKRHSKREPDEMRSQVYLPPAKANPGNVIRCKVGGGLMGSKLAHENEAPFPESLAEFFIKSFCPPGGVVLDPFCGSGTTGAVACRNGRGFIGIDIRQSQVDLTRRRIEEVRGEVKV